MHLCTDSRLSVVHFCTDSQLSEIDGGGMTRFFCGHAQGANGGLADRASRIGRRPTGEPAGRIAAGDRPHARRMRAAYRRAEVHGTCASPQKKNIDIGLPQSGR